MEVLAELPVPAERTQAQDRLLVRLCDSKVTENLRPVPKAQKNQIKPGRPSSTIQLERTNTNYCS